MTNCEKHFSDKMALGWNLETIAKYIDERPWIPLPGNCKAGCGIQYDPGSCVSCIIDWLNREALE